MTDRASAEGPPEAGTGITHERCGFLLACPCWTAGAALRSSESDSGIDVERLANAYNNVVVARGIANGWPMATWERIAREYARLSTPRTETSDGLLDAERDALL